MPSQALGKGEPLRIGETYFFDSIGEKGQLGEVTTATVNETDRQVVFSVTAEDGLSYIRKRSLGPFNLLAAAPIMFTSCSNFS